jgi:hypothetical protein
MDSERERSLFGGYIGREMSCCLCLLLLRNLSPRTRYFFIKSGAEAFGISSRHRYGWIPYGRERFWVGISVERCHVVICLLLLRNLSEGHALFLFGSTTRPVRYIITTYVRMVAAPEPASSEGTSVESYQTVLIFHGSTHRGVFGLIRVPQTRGAGAD